ncbi:MAG: type II toxin-antitoxin system toxin component ParE1 [Oceanicaulis sp. HLUCCA04]|nr:MAG: type II toxin-antitoxin system toxin component ParE1 [Oceanicaulis sp. HLUCCA04]
MAEFRLSPAAITDLEGIWHDTCSDWSEQQADAYIGQLFDAFAAMAEFPLAGKAADDIRLGYRRQRCGSHVIFYRPQDFGVEIVRILHGQMLAQLHL